MVVIPAVTEGFLTKVLSKVLNVPLVHAVPGSSPILPKISTYAEDEILYKAIASSPLKFKAVLFVVAPPYMVAEEYW